MDAFRFAVLFLVLLAAQNTRCTRSKTIVNKIKRPKSRGNTMKEKRHRLSVSRTSAILEHLLKPEHYDKRVRPDENEKVLNIGINVHFNTLSNLDEESMEFDIDIYLRQFWVDKRLNFTELHNSTHNERFIVIEPPDQVWTPDIFMENSKEASFHMVTKKNEIARLWPNGTLFYSVRISAKVTCFMQLYMFPVDIQKCQVKFGCFKYTIDDVNLQWQEWSNVQKVGISPNVRLARYTIHNIETSHEIANYGQVGLYKYLVIGITFKRDVGHYILQQYMPCSYIVLLSWVCFWIDGDCVGDRISIGVTLVLTIVLLQGSLNTNMPKVSYSKYIDYYFNLCLAFLMASVIESLVVYKFHNQEVTSASKVLEPKYSSQSLFMLRTRKENYWETTEDRLRIHPSVKSIGPPPDTSAGRSNISHKIDDISKLLFPASFIVFNIIYHFFFTFNY